jgi:hypothetical protein
MELTPITPLITPSLRQKLRELVLAMAHQAAREFLEVRSA